MPPFAADEDINGFLTNPLMLKPFSEFDRPSFAGVLNKPVVETILPSATMQIRGVFFFRSKIKFSVGPRY